MAANQALVTARTKARLSQRELAARVREAGKRLGITNGCNGTTVSRWESGEIPQPRMLACLEEALGATAETLGFGQASAAVSWLAPPGFPVSAITGPWVTAYQFTHDGKQLHHADIAQITIEPNGSIKAANQIAARTEGRNASPFRNEIEAQLASRHLIGRWRNTSDTRYFGMVHLAVLQGETVMDGYYTGFETYAKPGYPVHVADFLGVLRRLTTCRIR
jgi:transcriptional regulator with XRE-family HTH domain